MSRTFSSTPWAGRLRPAFLLILLFLFADCPVPPVPPHPVYVNVAICTASGLVPNEWCPADGIKTLQFIAGTEPTALCEVHHTPEPPAKTKVSSPWPESGELRAWSGTLYSTLSSTAAIIDETKLDALYEAMAVDGVNAERNFAWFSAFEDSWAGNYVLPWNDDWSWNETYWAQLDRRLKMWCGDRDGLEIISILDACSLYDGSSFETNPLRKLVTTGSQVYAAGPARQKVIEFALELWNRVKKYGTRVILETRNEGEQIVGYDSLRDFDHALLVPLKAAGVPAAQLAVEFFDSSLFYQTLSEDLEGKGLAETHRICSEVDADWYRNSPGKQGLAKLGDFPSSDGPSYGVSEDPPAYRAKGLTWHWLVGTQAEEAARRPSEAQISYIFSTMRGIGLPRYEHLSASAFQLTDTPDLVAAISIGRAERMAIR